MNTIYLDLPQAKVRSIFKKIMHCSKGVFLSPFYWFLSYRLGAPGLKFHFACVWFGIKLLFKFKKFSTYDLIINLIFFPMDSTRYFEFDFVWNALCRLKGTHYLDVSSPRILPILYLYRNHAIKAKVINPDSKDLAVTANLVKDCNLVERCELQNFLIHEVPFETSSFDIITCLSVLEHIPQKDADTALQKIWDLLKPGGRLLITLPCMADAAEQYISRNDYGILSPGINGYTFWQLYYDQVLLEKKIFSKIGKPIQIKIYGEKKAGFLAKNFHQKRLGKGYLFWREPYMMSKEFSFFNRIEDLPGEGVIAMEFLKP